MEQTNLTAHQQLRVADPHMRVWKRYEFMTPAQSIDQRREVRTCKRLSDGALFSAVILDTEQFTMDEIDSIK